MIGITFLAIGLVKTGRGRHIDFAPDDRFDPLGTAGVVKSNRSVEHAVIGQGNRILPAFFDALRDLFDTAGTVEKAVFAVQVQMNKSAHKRPPPFFSASSKIRCNR